MTRYTPLWEQQGTYAASVDRRLLAAITPPARTIGCAVSVSSGMTVNVAAGSNVIPTSNNTGSVLCVSDAVEPVTLAAAPGAGTNRYDLIVCQARGNDLDGGANNDFLFTTVTGVAAASPSIPATPNNSALLAHIYVPGGSASVTAGNITDRRFLGHWRGARAAAWSSAASLVLGMDTFSDGRGNTQPYQWGLNANAFTAPVAGLYLVNALATVTATAAGQYLQNTLQLNGGGWFNGPPCFAYGAGNVISSNAWSVIPLSVGDRLSMALVSGTVGLAGGTSGNFTVMQIQYLSP